MTKFELYFAQRKIGNSTGDYYGSKSLNLAGQIDFIVTRQKIGTLSPNAIWLPTQRKFLEIKITKDHIGVQTHSQNLKSTPFCAPGAGKDWELRARKKLSSKLQPAQFYQPLQASHIATAAGVKGAETIEIIGAKNLPVSGSKFQLGFDSKFAEQSSHRVNERVENLTFEKSATLQRDNLPKHELININVE